MIEVAVLAGDAGFSTECAKGAELRRQSEEAIAIAVSAGFWGRCACAHVRDVADIAGVAVVGKAGYMDEVLPFLPGFAALKVPAYRSHCFGRMGETPAQAR